MPERECRLRTVVRRGVAPVDIVDVERGRELVRDYRLRRLRVVVGLGSVCAARNAERHGDKGTRGARGGIQQFVRVWLREVRAGGHTAQLGEDALRKLRNGAVYNSN